MHANVRAMAVKLATALSTVMVRAVVVVLQPAPARRAPNRKPRRGP